MNPQKMNMPSRLLVAVSSILLGVGCGVEQPSPEEAMESVASQESALDRCFNDCRGYGGVQIECGAESTCIVAANYVKCDNEAPIYCQPPPPPLNGALLCSGSGTSDVVCCLEVTGGTQPYQIQWHYFGCGIMSEPSGTATQQCVDIYIHPTQCSNSYISVGTTVTDSAGARDTDSVSLRPPT